MTPLPAACDYCAPQKAAQAGYIPQTPQRKQNIEERGGHGELCTAAKPGGKQPLCYSPGSQLLFFQERRKDVIFPMQLEKLVEDNRQVAPIMGEATCPRQDVEMNTPGRCLIPCSFSPSSEQTLGKSIKEGPYDNYTTSE